MKRTLFLTSVTLLVLVTFAFALTPAKMNPLMNRDDRARLPGSAMTPAAPGDILWWCDAETACMGDFQLLGVEYKWGYFWITGGNSGVDPNKLYQLDDECNLIATFNQVNTTGWGLRDLAETEDYICASVSSMIDYYDRFGNYVMSNPGPENPNRALAYNMLDGVYWTGNFAGNIYSFTTPPLTILTSTADANHDKYGMAWDICSLDGPWLWIHVQDPVNMYQFDPVGLNYTGVVYAGLYFGSADVAGGACFVEGELHGDGGDVVGLSQNTPDLLYQMDIADPLVGPWACCKVTDVSVPEDFYLPGDVIELTVYWYYYDNGPWGMENAFVVGGGLGREPNGQPRFIQNHTTGMLSPGSYQEVFCFTVPMMTPLGTGVGGGGHCWPTWSGPNQPEQSVYIEHNLCVIDVYTPPEYLVYDLDPTAMSEQPIGDALAAMGHTYEITDDLMAWNLPDHLGLFVLLGMYPNNSQIGAFSPEAMAIEDYIYAGGKCYMEGGDSWYYDPQYMGSHDFGPAFGIMGLADGSSDLYQVDGVANTWMPGLDPLVSGYFGENNYVSWLAGTGGGEACFQNVAYAYYCGVANGSWGKTVGTSFEIGGVDFCGDFVTQFANW